MRNGQSGVSGVSLVCVEHFITRKSEWSPHPRTQTVSQPLGMGRVGSNLGCTGSWGKSYNQRGTELVASVAMGTGWVFCFVLLFWKLGLWVQGFSLPLLAWWMGLLPQGLGCYLRGLLSAVGVFWTCKARLKTSPTVGEGSPYKLKFFFNFLAFLLFCFIKL